MSVILSSKQHSLSASFLMCTHKYYWYCVEMLQETIMSTTLKLRTPVPITLPSSPPFPTTIETHSEYPKRSSRNIEASDERTCPRPPCKIHRSISTSLTHLSSRRNGRQNATEQKRAAFLARAGVDIMQPSDKRWSQLLSVCDSMSEFRDPPRRIRVGRRLWLVAPPGSGHHPHLVPSPLTSHPLGLPSPSRKAYTTRTRPSVN